MNLFRDFITRNSFVIGKSETHWAHPPWGSKYMRRTGSNFFVNFAFCHLTNSNLLRVPVPVLEIQCLFSRGYSFLSCASTVGTEIF